MTLAKLMTLAEFAARAMGFPVIRWRKWYSDWKECDCYGLIVLGFREMRGIDLGPVPQTDIAEGFSRARGWVECGPEAGATCWMSWRDGKPTHCGWMLDAQRVLHCEGSEDRPGGVRISRLSAIELIYGEIKFYRYEPC
jgi:hypothetical protein